MLAALNDVKLVEVPDWNCGQDLRSWSSQISLINVWSRHIFYDDVDPYGSNYLFIIGLCYYFMCVYLHNLSGHSINSSSVGCHLSCLSCVFFHFIDDRLSLTMWLQWNFRHRLQTYVTSHTHTRLRYTSRMFL